MNQGRESKKVVDAVMDREKVKRRTAPGEREGKERKNRKTVQIFVKVNGLKEFLLDVSMTDKVSDIVRRIPNNTCYFRQEMYVMCEGRVLRWSDELRSSGVGDGCTLYVLNMMRGGGKHRNKKNKARSMMRRKLARTQNRRKDSKN